MRIIVAITTMDVDEKNDEDLIRIGLKVRLNQR